MELRLVVLRTTDPARLAAFYELLGLRFEHHRHGNGPWHYAATVGAATLEIYPLPPDQAVADAGLRLGLALDDFEVSIARLRAAGARFSAEPAPTAFGFRAVVVDPDGRRVELYRP